MWSPWLELARTFSQTSLWIFITGMSLWSGLIIAYLFLATLTLTPTLRALFWGVRLNKGGASFENSQFSSESKKRLEDHYSRIEGTLLFWKKSAEESRQFHYYCLAWTIISSSLMPFLTQAIDPSEPTSKWLLTLISAHIALLLALHRGFRISDRYRAFRHGESEFYDTYRRLLDRPQTFGTNESIQLMKYFEEVEIIRRFVRNAETDTLPNIDDVKDQITKSRTSG